MTSLLTQKKSNFFPKQKNWLNVINAFHPHHIGVVSIHNPKFPFGNHHHPHRPLGFCLKHLH